MRRAIAACAVACALTAGLTSEASASSDTYCPGCTIYGYCCSIYNSVEDTAWYFITLDYVHRLSGPYCTDIGAYAHYADDGSYGNYAYNQSCSEAVQHGYPGNRPAWGGATNFGAGNYGFNAHVDY